MIKIIIADDSAMLRERIKSLLMDIENVEIVGEADNGITALRLIKETDPDLIILDIRMPGMNGIETLSAIKKSGSPTKVCILTNYPYPQYEERCIAEGADYFFDKNQDYQKMGAMIAELAQAHPGDLHE